MCLDGLLATLSPVTFGLKDLSQIESGRNQQQLQRRLQPKQQQLHHRYERVEMKKTIEVNDIDKLVLIATLPRSGSSMDCGILEIAGAFGGDTIGEVPANPKGIFENKWINQMLIRPIVMEMGIRSSRGLKTIADIGGPPKRLFESYAEDLIYGMNRQGYKNGVAYFKNGLHTFFFDRINEVLPDAIWVLPMRSREGVIFSNKRIHPDRKEKGVRREIDDYHDMYKHISDVAKERVYFIDNDALIGGDFSQMKGLVSDLGLEWNEDKVKEWIDGTMWGDQPDREPFRGERYEPSQNQEITRDSVKRAGNN
jgi:hypothetical protein